MRKRFRIDHDIDCFFRVCFPVDIDVTVADSRLKNGNGCVLNDFLNEGTASPGDEYIDMDL